MAKREEIESELEMLLGLDRFLKSGIVNMMLVFFVGYYYYMNLVFYIFLINKKNGN